MPNIEISGSVYDHPGKGHDRLFISEQKAFAAVFDGAGGAELSQAAVDDLSRIPASEAAHFNTNPLQLDQLLLRLDNLPEGQFRKATAALAQIHRTAGQMSLKYANLGDSSLYFYDHSTRNIKLIAHTPTSYIEAQGYSYIATDEFLGNFRSQDEIRRLIGSLVLPTTTEWSIIGCSDGVCDDEGQGIELPELIEILSTKSSQIADSLLDSFEKYDDASVFVMSYRK